MKHAVLIVALAAIPLLTSSTAPQSTVQGDPNDAEDRGVLMAVIDHTIRPEVQRLTHLGSSAVLYLINHTLTRCQGGSSPRARPFCMPAASGDDLRDGKLDGMSRWRVGPIPADVIPSAAQRNELVSSYQARNTQARLLPVPEGGDIKLVADPPALTSSSGGAMTSYTVFSLPGYSSEGFATLHAFYDCGGRCGTTWRWLLEKRDGQWHVRARYVTGMF
jgi:hypothetical protein